MNDVTAASLHAALRGLAARQRVIADNIANVETPGFLAGRVDFETTLRGALEHGADPGRSELITSSSRAETGVNGNNVQLDEETVSLIDTNLRYQTAVEAMNAKFRLLRTAINGAGR